MAARFQPADAPARYVYACAPGLPRQLVEDLGPEPNPWSHDLAPREDWRRILRLDTGQPVILPACYVSSRPEPVPEGVT